MSRLNDILDEKKCTLELVQWQENKNPMYAYVLIKKNLLAAFRQALTERDVDLSEFGVVMAHGEGNEASVGTEEQLIKAIEKAA